MQTTKRLQRSLASYFFPLLPPLFQSPNPFGGRVETWEWKFGLRDTGFEVSREREREREWEGIGNDVSPKVTDQPEFSRFLWISCVSIVKKKKKILLVEEERLILRIKIFLDQEYLRYAEQTVRTIIVPKLIVVNWCRADEIISAPCSAINASTPNFLPLRNTLCIYIRLWSRKFLVNEFFHRYLSVKWIIIVSMFGPFLFMDHALPGSLWSIDVAILRIVYSVSIFLLFFFFHFTSLTLFFSYIEFLSREYFLRLIFEMTMKYIYIFLYIIILIKIIIIID